jgi:tyrosinase
VNVRDVPPDEALVPFHTRDNGDPSEDYWTSTMARDWTKLLYQYDDLVPSQDAILPDKTLDEKKYQTELLQYIQKTYPNTSQIVDSIVQNPDISNESFLGADDGTWPDYIINVVYDRYALNGRSYSIQFYLGGDPNNRDSTFQYPENFVGKVYSFGGLPLTTADGTAAGSCANCAAQSNAKVLSKAQVPITHQLIRQALDDGYHHIGNILADDIETYLAGHLHWKFVAIGAIEKDATDFPDTKISVWSGTGMPRSIDQNPVGLPPKYENYAPIHAATDNKPGGLARDDPVLGEDARGT